jgi:hypothetical protein
VHAGAELGWLDGADPRVSHASGRCPSGRGSIIGSVLVAYSKPEVPKLVIDGEVVPLEPSLHPTYAEILSRSGDETARSFDRLAEIVENLIEASRRGMTASDHAKIERDVRRELDGHERHCECLVWWSKVVADKE